MEKSIVMAFDNDDVYILLSALNTCLEGINKI